jgi:hypothetical protein
MSLNINQENLYLVLPSNVSFKESNIGDSMENDFTLFARVKIDKEKLTEKEAFILSRSGMHSGISVFKNEIGKVFLQYTYWFKNDEDGTNYIKQVNTELSDTLLENYINVYMVNNDEKSKISCYLNGDIVGSIVYPGFKKISYVDSPYWIGCGSMFTEGDSKGIGDFEYDVVFSVKKRLSNIDVDDILKNYYSTYSETVFETYKVFSKSWELSKYFAFFCDFKISNRYKIWNYAFNGNYPQIYIEGNVYY